MAIILRRPAPGARWGLPPVSNLNFRKLFKKTLEMSH